MLHLFADPSDVQDELLTITGPEVNHIRNVMRLKPGEEISVSIGGDGKEYRYGIESYTEDSVLCRLRFVKDKEVELPVKVLLFQGLPKADKMDLIVQKAVELGAAEHLLFCILFFTPTTIISSKVEYDCRWHKE